MGNFMDVTCGFQVNATLVSNEFIDQYMAAANGEYVKVYLYLLRCGQEHPDIVQIADALNHTEADVKRALAYWEKAGALQMGTGAQEAAAAENQTAASRMIQCQAAENRGSKRPAAKSTGPAGKTPASEIESGTRTTYSQEQVNQLATDEEFTQLLYIAQKYLNKVFTPRECEVYAYLYDGLKIPAELLEYLTEYCVQGGHISIRYLETVALNWHQKGLVTVEAAKAYATGFTKNSFAVMKAFGLTDRGPGDSEKELIECWFMEYGFTKEVVLEACNRTMATIHSPSFRYADKILKQWKTAGVRSLKDIEVLDQKHQKHQNQPGKQKSAAGRKPANQFHNFEQRNTDYNSMVLDQVSSWIGEA